MPTWHVVMEVNGFEIKLPATDEDNAHALLAQLRICYEDQPYVSFGLEEAER